MSNQILPFKNKIVKEVKIVIDKQAHEVIAASNERLLAIQRTLNSALDELEELSEKIQEVIDSGLHQTDT